MNQSIEKQNYNALIQTLPKKADLKSLDHKVQCLVYAGLEVMEETISKQDVDLELKVKAFNAILNTAKYVEARKEKEIKDSDELLIDDEEMVI